MKKVNRPLWGMMVILGYFGAALLMFSCKKENRLGDTTVTAVTTDTQLQTEAQTFNTPLSIFDGGTSGYHSYRIPSIVRTTKGTLLAFCEGRINNANDWGAINVVCRRSTDNGATWGTLFKVAGNSTDTWGNPTAVVDQSTGTIWLFMSWNDAAHSQSGGGGLLPINVNGQRKVYLTSSSAADDGAANTWAVPTDMTSTLQPTSYTWDAMGPGIGICKLHAPNAGALIIPALGRNIYSTNNGASWAYETLPASDGSEATVFERLSGVLMRNDRPTGSDTYRRISTGSLTSWTNAFTLDTQLPDPRCEGSIMRYNEPKPNRVYFLNSNSTSQRRHPTIRITYDEGGTWAIARELPQPTGGPILGGYSSLVKTADLMTGALVELNENNTTANMSIQFFKFNLSWILNGTSEPAGY